MYRRWSSAARSLNDRLKPARSVPRPSRARAASSQVTAVTGDDAALALLGLDADLGGFKQLFKDRAAELQHRYIDPLEELEGQVRRAEQQLAELRASRAEVGGELWGAYKPGYERYLAAEAPAGEEAR